MLWALLTAGMFALARARAELPDRVASHFDAAGKPDGWCDKDEFLLVYLGILFALTLLFGVLGAVLPRIPNSMINLPNKDYWLAPERRSDTIDRLVAQLLWIGNATLLLVLVMFRLSWIASLGDKPDLGGWMWIAAAAYLVIVLWLAFALIARFRKAG